MDRQNKVTDDDLPLKLSKLIESRQTEILRVFNGALISMFWQIGKIITFCTKTNKATTEKIVKNISKPLLTYYGPFFSNSNLEKMVKLYNIYPEFSTVQLISSIVGWEQIKLVNHRFQTLIIVGTQLSLSCDVK